MTGVMRPHVIWGSNTGVGKTLVSAGLMAAARRRACAALYLKPAQTGFPTDADGGFVARLSDRLVPAVQMSAGRAVEFHGAHAREAAQKDGRVSHAMPSEAGAWFFAHGTEAPPPLVCETLFAWQTAVGPHLAVQYEGRPVGDDALVSATREALAREPERLTIVETFGGVASLMPSGSLQCDALL